MVQESEAEPARKWEVEQYESHAQVRKAYVGLLPRRPGQPKPVRRKLDADGFRLPTEDEVAHVHRIAGPIRFSLPRDFERHLWFVRSFLDAFCYGRGRKDIPKDQIRRRCSIARQFAFEDRSFTELAEKLGLPKPVAEVLFEYGRQRVPARWRHDDASVPDDVVLLETSDEDSVESVAVQAEWFDHDGDQSGADAAMNSMPNRSDAGSEEQISQ